MGAYSTIRITREKALAAWAAINFNPTNEQLERSLGEALEPILMNVTIVWDGEADDDWTLAYVQRLIDRA